MISTLKDELMPFDLPQNQSNIIKVLGVGGGGSNAVNHMYRQGIKDVDFVICNTDAQALTNSPVPTRIQLGDSLTEGRGAGNKPEIGRQAAIENLDDIIKVLNSNTKMVFITAGMGGGTGTGAAPVLAKAAKELGILTVGIVTIPFRHEGSRRINQAYAGLKEIKEHVDSLLVIDNQKLFELYKDLKISEAFSKADDILAIAAKGIAEIITIEGLVNVDFEDVKTVMAESGAAILGTGIAEGTNRAIDCIREALNSPLSNNNDISGARNILVNIVSGANEATMDEFQQISEYVQEATGHSADLIWGTSFDDSLDEKLSVTIIATGFDIDTVFQKLSMEQKLKFQTTKIVKKNDMIMKRNNEIKKRRQTIDEILAPDSSVSKVREVSLDPETDKISSTNENNIRNHSDEKVPQRTEMKNKNQKSTNISKSQNYNLFANRFKLSTTNFNPEKYKENIDHIENEPAFVRKKVVFEDLDFSCADVDRYSLSDTWEIEEEYDPEGITFID